MNNLDTLKQEIEAINSEIRAAKQGEDDCFKIGIRYQEEARGVQKQAEHYLAQAGRLNTRQEELRKKLADLYKEYYWESQKEK